jgi:hypothetical protein
MPSPEASRRNLQKARACWRPPQRSEGIKHFVWEWYISTAPKEAGRALARRLGVSHTYVRKLVRKFLREPLWPPVLMQEVEMPCADAPLKDLGHQQSVSRTDKPKPDAASESDERARDERLREYGELIARKRPRMRRFLPGRSWFLP